jgi:hypothetical protein
MPITRDEITEVFRLLLARRPVEATYAAHAALPDVETLIRKVVLSPQFTDHLVSRFHQRMTEGLRPLQDRVVNLHIPKCGGTTLHHLLTAWWSPEAVHRERFNGLYYYSAANLASKQVFSGHYDFYSIQLVPGRPRLISFLREPKQRLVSLYNFHRAHRPDAARQNRMVQWAQEQDIDAYFANETVRSHAAIDNTFARYLSDVPQVPHRWIEQTAPLAPPVEVMAEQALANLQRFDFIGFLDRYDASIARLAALLGKPGPGEVPKHQVLDRLMDSNPGMRKIEKQEPSRQTLAEMEDLVRFDQQIYAAARSRFAVEESLAG